MRTFTRVGIMMKYSTHRFRVAKSTSQLPTNSPRNGSSLNIQACERCRRLKKKCTKDPPQCALCIAQGQDCSLGQDSTPSHPRPRELSTQVSDNDSQVQQAIITNDSPHLSYVLAYFSHVHRAYPFLDKERIIQKAKTFSPQEPWADDAESTILSLVMAIGSTTLERAGKLEPTDRPRLVVPYTNILTRCLSSPSIEGLQILTLLSLYSLFNVQGVSTWTVVGILTRQAVVLGLSRNETYSEELALDDQELRHRLFWSIFVLDRMVAVSIGHPAGLVDDNMTIPQPAVTVLEFASSDSTDHASLLQLNRHIIQLRQLEHRILSCVHLRKYAELAKLNFSDRKVLSAELRSSIDDWYSHACLVSLPETDNIPIHSTVTWLNARYYNLLILLYYPCHFNSQSRHAPAKHLLACVSKFMSYNRILLEQRQLPLNYITLDRLIPACLVLLHCFATIQPQTFSAKLELDSCIAILRAFPATWSSAHQTASVMSEFAELIASHEAYASHQLVHFVHSNRTPLQTSTTTWLHNLRIDLSHIIRKTLSNASCYLGIERWDDSENGRDDSFDSLSQISGTSPDMPASWVMDCSYELGWL